MVTKKKKVMVFGTFDILHPGHIYFLRKAKKYGDFLIVSIARDPVVKKIKGRAPLHAEKDRADLLKSLKFVDKVVLGSKHDYIAHIVKEKPDVIVLGYDQKAFTEGLEEKLKKKGRKKVKIVRLEPYKHSIYKSAKLLQYP